MNRLQLIEQIQQKKSFLCIGLDADLDKIPAHLRSFDDPVFEFNKQLIDATHSYCVAYKPNTAFYESRGVEGWKSLEKTIEYLNQHYPKLFTIADAKRGDIGNTSQLYAKAFFETLPFDSITVAPYMGEDSVKPFLAYPNKWVIVLALTSNKGADDFQFTSTDENEKQLLFQKVIRKTTLWGTDQNLMFVVGATRPEMLLEIRKLIPTHFLLVPGVGAQGGSLKEVAKYGMTKHCGLLVNASRSIIFADSSVNFAQSAAVEAKKMQQEMSELLSEYSVNEN
ncbi:MAG: orotidine-5'-phosphate decarboxylase [Bacteroidetes bacterium]|nr:orotidine-5'-phosphate decarboxylase [Bacteroidota bacterium]